MSRIQQTFEQLKKQKERESWKDGKRVTFSIRIDEFTLFCLDELVKEVGGTRNGNAAEIISASVLDGLESFGRSFDSLQESYMNSQGEGLFVDGVKVEDPEDFQKNPEKYMHPDRIRKATEEEIQRYEYMEKVQKEGK